MDPRYDDRVEEIKPFLDFEEPTSRGRPSSRGWRRFLPWILTGISWIITIYTISSRTQCPNPDTSLQALVLDKQCPEMPTPECPPTPKCPQHWETDFPGMQPVVAYETRQFRGELVYENITNRIVRNLTDADKKYFGPPNPEIDQNWRELLHGEFPVMLDEEAKPFTPELVKLRTDHQYHWEPMVFHELHCLNAIRMAIDVNFYGEDAKALHHHADLWPQEDWERIHMDHCLDMLRQSLMCHADLSPVPLYSWPDVPLAIGIGGTHTCRKWEPIRQWMNDRNKVYRALDEY